MYCQCTVFSTRKLPSCYRAYKCKAGLSGACTDALNHSQAVNGMLDNMINQLVSNKMNACFLFTLFFMKKLPPLNVLYPTFLADNSPHKVRLFYFLTSAIKRDSGLDSIFLNSGYSLSYKRHFSIFEKPTSFRRLSNSSQS